MANLIKLRKGLDINLKGKATAEVMSVKEPGFYALCPDDFTGVTPKVVVKEQGYVMAGGPLFIDKNHPEVKFVSPVSGVVTSVERGARRKVMSITVEASTGTRFRRVWKEKRGFNGWGCCEGSFARRRNVCFYQAASLRRDS